MSDIRSIHEMQDYIDKEHSWRIKEISDMRSAVKSSEGLQEDTLIRASIPLLYAHWEGFIKNASEAYLQYVSNGRYKYNELRPCFAVHGLKKRLNELSESSQTRKNIRIVEFLMNELNERATLSYKGLIDTQANLNSNVFENIASSIGVDTRFYETKYNFIDESLLKRRNSIAHGDYLDVDKEQFIDISYEVLKILRHYKNDIENATVTDEYKRD